MYMNRLARGLLIFALLASQTGSYAQTTDFEKSPYAIFQDTLLVDDNLSPAGTPLSDQQKTKCQYFKARQLILPGVLIAVGSYGVWNGAFKHLNTNIKNEMDNLRGTRFFHYDDYLQYLPAITYLTFGSIGVKSKHCFKERMAIEITAYLSMAALTNVGKYLFKERRPDSNARNSFPSGHTATVFTGAELMREEYGPWYGIGAYAVALGVAYLRLYNGRHWLNDVIAGAGVGILSARIGYWMLPIYRRWFKWDDDRSDVMMVSPAFNPAEHSLSINLVYAF